MLHQRLTLGPLLIVALVGCVWFDEWLEQAVGLPGLIFFPLMLIAGILGAMELSRMFRARHIASAFPLTAAAVVLGLSISSLTRSDLGNLSGVSFACTGAAFVLLLSFVYYSRNQSTEGVVIAASTTLMAFVYIGLMGGFILVLRREYSAWVVLGVLLATKSCDIGAFFTGISIGRHKLIPWLSPGKTWEGLIGGVLTSTLVGVLLIVVGRRLAPETHGLPFEMTALHGAVAGAVFGLVGQGGDLIASLLKRDAGVKDSSRILPGFGGVLDVIDSPLLVAPVAYWLLAILSG